MKKKEKNNNKKSTKKDEIKTYEENILSSPKNLNLFNKLLETFVNAIQNYTPKEGIKSIDKILDSFDKIYQYYLMDENIKSSNEVINFLNSKLELIFSILLDLFSQDEEYLSIIFKIFNRLIIYIQENKYSGLYKKIILNLIKYKKKLPKEIAIEFYETFNNYDKYSYILNAILDIIQNEKLKTEDENNCYNLYILITNISNLDDLNKDKINKDENKNELKNKYQNIITIILNNDLFPNSMLKDFMKELNKSIIKNVSNPIIFSDYLLQKTSNLKCKSITDFDIKILGLSSLFILLTKFNLDYDKYYELLYKLISQKINTYTIFDSKYKDRILKLLEMSLSSDQIPYVVICSFIKKLLRICLFATDEIIYSLLSLVMKLIQIHPRTLNLIMDNKSKKILKQNIENNSVFMNNKGTDENLQLIKKNISLDEEEEEKCGWDNFDETSVDPFQTNADKCSLWELYSFTRHYNMNIRKLVNKFSRNFLAKEIEMEVKNKKEMLFDIKNLNSHFYINN